MLNYSMRTLRATIDKEGKVELLEPVTLNDTRQALVTILEEDTRPQTSLLTFLDHLASIPFSPRSPDEIEADIQAERNAWDE